MLKVLMIALLLLWVVAREEARRTVEQNIRAAWTSAGTIEKLRLVVVDCDSQVSRRCGKN